MLTLLNQLKQENLISEGCYQFAKFIARKQQGYDYSTLQQDLAVLLAGLLAFNVLQGHSAVRLTSHSAQNPFGLRGRKQTHELGIAILQKIEEISPLEWGKILEGHIAFSNDPSDVRPMLFQGELLYFYRYWQAENEVAKYLQQAVSSEPQNAEIALNQQILSQFYPTQDEKEKGQKIAVATALAKKFCVISGGPGTGKTRTVAMLLVALQQRQQKLGLPLLNIALAAPTGKAAARLKESITDNLKHIHHLSPALKSQVPMVASTLHRLLGIKPLEEKPLYHQQNPLHLDLLVVDEVSMIDLSLMQKLLNALKAETRLILLGDKDQLASVEAGSIMSELGQFLAFGYSATHADYLAKTTGDEIFATSNALPICDSLCHLRHSYRFDQHSGIGNLASHINAQEERKSWRDFEQYADLTLEIYPDEVNFASKSLWLSHCVNLVVEKAVALYRPYLDGVKQRMANPQAVSIEEIFTAFNAVRLLSALRVSELGVENLNQRIAEALRTEKLVHFTHSRDSYFGKPILVTENAPHLQIFSGDIGIMLPDEEGQLRLYFDTKIDGQYLSISASRVPSYESAYVMTVHKSQGSEFAHTLLVMPLANSPVLSKELLYTAVTRAKKHFTLFSLEKVWQQGVKQKCDRQSGLKEQIERLLTSV